MHNFIEIGQVKLLPIYIAIYRFLKMTAARHVGFVGQILGRPTKSIWWSLSLGKIWFEYFNRFDNTKV